MKRSKMIELMTLAYQQSQFSGNSEMSDEKRMEYILYKLQEAGMEFIIDKGNGYGLQIGWDEE